MSHSVSKDGPYFTSGPISFSQLASTWGGSSTNIKASDYIRNTNVSETNPRVPDATENAQIAASSSAGSNWRLSQFRNSIKTYYVTQSGTDINASITGTPSWNSNLNKNIKKFYYLTGTAGSNSTSVALSASGTVYNLRVEVSGSILGYGGRGGGTSGAPAISGENGGDALSMGTSGASIAIVVSGGGRIYGGGGGGEKGKTGDNGADGTCSYVSRQQGGCGCPGCPGGWQDLGCGQNYGSHCDRRQECNGWGNCWWVSNGDSRYNDCRYTYTVTGGVGGVGGNGGPGRGYNNQSGSLTGSNGAAGGDPQGCTAGGSYAITPQKGKDGEKGGDGGEWANAGQNTANSGSGGSAGRAITGGNYSVSGSTGSSNIKGAY